MSRKRHCTGVSCDGRANNKRPHDAVFFCSKLDVLVAVGFHDSFYREDRAFGQRENDGGGGWPKNK